jgi:hypothetical protein
MSRFDPYTQVGPAVARLVDEYKKHNKLIVAVDFDDTLYDYHQKGFTYLRVLHLLHRCQELGFYIVLFTAAPPERWDSQKEYLRHLGVEVSSVNSNPINLPFGNHGKIYYNVLLDDRAGLGQACLALETALWRIDNL